MTQPMHRVLDPRLDLLLERIVDVPPALMWAAWTQPEHIKQWFTPVPWRTTECEVDLRPGGIFRTVMESPEGEKHTNVFCFLEIVPNERLVWTEALEPGFRPKPERERSVPPFTAVISFEPHGSGTRYTALAMHRNERERQRHETLGFYDGWGTVLDQLVAMLKGEAAQKNGR